MSTRTVNTRRAQHKTDFDLQALHAAVPFVVTWDDHEFANDASSGGAENHTEGVQGLCTARRAASRQADAEWMPVRFEPGGRMYRRFTFGKLASCRREQFPFVPVTGHAQHNFTMDALIAMVDGVDPDFVFTNLGDVDRLGHSEVTGTTCRPHGVLPCAVRQSGRPARGAPRGH